MTVENAIHRRVKALLKSMSGTKKQVKSQLNQARNKMEGGTEHKVSKWTSLGGSSKLTILPHLKGAPQGRKLLAEKNGSNTAKKLVKGELDQVMKRVKDKVQGAASKATASLKKVASVLKARMPKIKSLRMSDIYLDCLLNPSTCDHGLVKKAVLHVCFTDIGCTKGSPVNAGTLKKWLRQKAVRLMVQWLRKALRYTDVHVELPLALSSVHGVINGLSKQEQVIQFPVGVHEDVLKKFTARPKERSMAAQAAKNDGFTAGSVEAKAFKNIESVNIEATAKMEAKVERSVKKAKGL
jgi:hypothetical protein